MITGTIEDINDMGAKLYYSKEKKIILSRTDTAFPQLEDLIFETINCQGGKFEGCHRI